MALFLIIPVAFTTAFADESQPVPLISIEVGEVSENGYFDVTVSMENLHFIAFQLAVKYDSSVVVPAAVASGEPAEKYGDFARTVSIPGVSYIGQSLDTEKGYFVFTGYVSPGASGEMFRDKMIYIDEKTELCRFRFKKITDGDMGFDIASIYNGDVYHEYFPDGAIVSSSLEKRYVSSVEIRYGDTAKKTETVYYSYSELYPSNFTKEQRLLETVYVVNGDYAAAVDGVLAAIEKGSRDVVPYVKDEIQYFPLRFICESLGLEVGWDGTERKVTVTAKDGKSVLLDVKSEAAVTDGKEIKGNAEIVNSRTMVSADLICALTGARIYDAGNGGYIIYSAIPEWTPDREAEKEALAAMQYVLMPFFRMFL